jgi:hypothetical protein
VERAQLVWAHTLELASQVGDSDPRGVALELLRAADQDQATVEHALVLGRSRIREDPEDEMARRATVLLEATTGLLGVKPRPNQADASGSRR